MKSVATLGPLGYRVYLQFMAAVERALRRDTAYTERQCGACPYEHKCCTLPVWLQPFEASAILWFLNSRTMYRPGAWKAKIKARARAYRDAAKGATGVDADGRWIATHTPCIFYDLKKRRCGIYEARPIACRALYSVADCNASKWIGPNSELPLLRRLEGLMGVVSPDLKNPIIVRVAEMTTLLDLMIEHPEMVTVSRGPADSLIGMVHRVKSEIIPDDELLFGAP